MEEQQNEPSGFWSPARFALALALWLAALVVGFHLVG
jgi:hypothetical protein